MNYISKKMSLRFLSSVAASVLLGQASLLLKPIVAGHYLGGNALAVMALANPIIEFCFSVVLLLSAGASYIVTECISLNDSEKACKHFTVAAITTTSAVAVMALLLFLFRSQISIFLCGNQSGLVGMMEQYLTSLSWSCIPLGVFNFINFHYIAVGSAKLSIYSNFLVSFADLLLSVVLLQFFDMGVTGLSLSFTASLTLGVIFYLILMRSVFSLRIVPVQPDFFSYLRENLKKGLPLLLNNSLYIAFILFCNLIVANKIDSVGMIVWGVVATLIDISATVLTISSLSSNTLGKEMIAVRDYRGLLQMMNFHRSVVFLVISALLVFVELFPGTLMRVFGVTEITCGEGIDCLRMMAPIIFVTSFAGFVSSNYYLLDRNKSYIGSTAVFSLGPVVILFILSMLNPNYSILAFSVSAAICTVISLFIILDVNIETKKSIKQNVSVELTIPYDFSAIGPALASIRSFLLENEAGMKSADAVEHCVDELLYNIIKHATGSSIGKSIELRSVMVMDEIIVMFKYDGKPFNPIIDFKDKAVDALASDGKLQLALRVFNHYAIKPYYHFGYGINFLSMTL